MIVPFLDHAPIDNPPQGLEVRGAAVLVVEVVGVFPDVEGEEGAEAVGDGVVGAGVLADGQGVGGIGLEPDPAGAEEADALGDELFPEGFEGAPLGFDLGLQGAGRAGRAGRPFDCFDKLSRWARRTELGEVEVVVQDLAGVVEDGAGGLGHNLLQGHRLELGAGDEFVEVVHVGLQVLAVVEGQGAGADDGLEDVDRIG